MFSMSSDFGDGEEEDVKPSIEYLDSLNDYRKRSRSLEDVDGGVGTPKMARINGHVETSSAEAQVREEPVAAINGVAEPVEQSALSTSADERIVYGTHFLLFVHLPLIRTSSLSCSLSSVVGPH